MRVDKNGFVSVNDRHLLPKMFKSLETVRSLVPCTFRALVEGVHAQDPALAEFCRSHSLTLKPRDKGKWGKMVEFYVFGRLPNNSSEPDLGEEIGDIKATHFKRTKHGWTAKERLTLTNCGTTSDYTSFERLLSGFTTNPFYTKLRRGVVVALEHSACESVWDERVLAMFRYDIEALPTDMRTVLESDYAKIQERVRSQTVSQAGQQYLHIHPHGPKGSNTRALGFTNKFLTKLLCHYSGREMRIVGRSWVFNT